MLEVALPGFSMLVVGRWMLDVGCSVFPNCPVMCHRGGARGCFDSALIVLGWWLDGGSAQIVSWTAAGDSRTPGRWRAFRHAASSARSWSAAVPCRCHF